MPRRTTPMPFGLLVGARIRALRLEHGMSLADLAVRTFISKGHLWSVERGLSSITIETVRRLAERLGVAAFYILAFPAEDARAELADLVRRMPPKDVTKLRRELRAQAKKAGASSGTTKLP